MTNNKNAFQNLLQLERKIIQLKEIGIITIFILNGTSIKLQNVA